MKNLKEMEDPLLRTYPDETILSGFVGRFERRFDGI